MPVGALAKTGPSLALSTLPQKTPLNLETLLPLTGDPWSFPVGNQPLCAHQQQVTHASGLPPINHSRNAFLAGPDLQLLSPSGPTTLVADDSSPIAWLGEAPDPDSAVTARASFLIRHPWDLLRANELVVGAITDPDIHGDIHSAAIIEGTVHLGPGSRILPGVLVEGNVIIGANCKIGPNCYVRGATSIGDRCHIGQAVEIKNSIICSHTNVGHLSYLGDSILGKHVNLGAGTIVSNLRHDGTNHRSMIGDQLVDTGRRKFGAIIGDGVHTGINTSIYPGRKLWPNTSTRPGQVVDKDLTPES
jgi:acetyltransferase-like isoleucine patch superfamily enzyme